MRLPNVRSILRLGIVGILILLAILLSDWVWSFVASFITPLFGALGPVTIVIGFILWFCGIAFMAAVVLYVLRRFTP